MDHNTRSVFRRTHGGISTVPCSRSAAVAQMSDSSLPYPPVHPLSKPGEPVWEIATLFPAQGSWSEEEYLGLSTNRLVEFDGGRLELLPTPTLLHQLIVRFLYHALSEFVARRGLGEVFFAPLPVRLWEGKYREPDLVFLRLDRLGNLRGQPEGADLVVEVMSEGEENRRRDLVEKRHDYARAGVAEYWIVDPQQRRIEVLALEGDAYRSHGQFADGQTLTSPMFPGCRVAVSEVFAAAEAGADEERSRSD